MPGIKTISYRRILNSHVEFTNEFVIELTNGSIGVGSAPRGETTSIYEDSVIETEPEEVIEIINQRYCGISLNQDSFDDRLKQDMRIFGRSNCFALSLAFFDSTNKCSMHLEPHTRVNTNKTFPKLCMNILNGGKHAYTNPVLSDFHEYLLVAKSTNLREIVEDHSEIQSKVREKLRTKNRVVVDDNPVHKFRTADNRECIEFLLGIIEDLKLTCSYDLMIDASAGDLLVQRGYLFSLTDNSLKTSDELFIYWIDMITDYNIRFLEDPFHEKDYESWRKLTATQDQCKIIGDNIYSSDPERIHKGAANKYTDGVLIHPDQSGTVSSAMSAIEKAQSNEQIVITSHRSISTESTFLTTITHMLNVEYIKVGPLCTDYSSVIRLNELIRLT